ncbi:MAG TPA: hypothetical protein VN962_16720 [Polyangia bacterium]|nr:hypothetical protein [Polyangia bacterium]
MKSKAVLLVTIALLAGALFALRRGPRPPPAAGTQEVVDVGPPLPAPATDPPPPAPDPLPPAARPRRSPPATPPGPTEAALMSQLRELGASDPARALALARDGNRRFAGGAGAAERSWTISKSLAALGRAAEARDEARRMVAQYPDTEWANDVRRHLLSQPLEHPEQRGYGKASEIEPSGPSPRQE